MQDTRFMTCDLTPQLWWSCGFFVTVPHIFAWSYQKYGTCSI